MRAGTYILRKSMKTELWSTISA